MSKGSSKQQTINNAPWAGAQPHWLNLLNSGAELSQGTGISPRTNTLGTRFINEATGTPALTNQTENFLSKTMAGGFSNPYTSGAMGDAMDMAKAKINAQFAGDNSGSSAHKEWLGRGITAAGLPFAQQSYESDMGRRMQAASMAPGLGMQELARLGQGLQVSQQFDDAPWNQLQRYGSLLQGAGGGQTTQPVYRNSAAETIGTLGSLAMLGSFMFSDARLKTDIKKVGEREDGLGIYEYRYKGEPEKHIGLMAQEVLMKQPEAVEDIGGLLAVDYAKVK